MERAPARALPLPSLQSELPAAPGSSRSRRHRRRTWWVQRVPWTIYGYIAGEVFRVFMLGVIAISLIYATLAAYQTVRSGVQLSFIWPILLSTVAYPLYFSVPISFLFAITLVVGRLVGDLEINALRTHGIGHAHVYAPVLGLGVVLCAVSYYLNGWIVPQIHYDKRNLQSYILKQIENLGSGAHRTILLPDGEGTLWVGAYEGSELKRVRVDLVPDKDSGFVPAIREHILGSLPQKVTIVANEGRIEINPDRKSLVLSLRSVEVLIPEVVRGEVFHQRCTVSDSIVVPLAFMDKTPGTKDRTSADLTRYIEYLRRKLDPRPIDPEEEGIVYAAYEASDSGETRRETLERKIASALTELHRRRAFAFSCLTFPLLGVSLSLLLNKHSRIIPFFFGNLTVIGLYYPLLMIAVALGDAGFVPGLSMALPNLALLVLGAFLTRKVLTR